MAEFTLSIVFKGTYIRVPLEASTLKEAKEEADSLYTSALMVRGEGSNIMSIKKAEASEWLDTKAPAARHGERSEGA